MMRPQTKTTPMIKPQTKKTTMMRPQITITTTMSGPTDVQRSLPPWLMVCCLFLLLTVLLSHIFFDPTKVKVKSKHGRHTTLSTGVPIQSQWGSVNGRRQWARGVVSLTNEVLTVSVFPSASARKHSAAHWCLQNIAQESVDSSDEEFFDAKG